MRKFILFISLTISTLSIFGQAVVNIQDTYKRSSLVAETVFFDDKIGNKTFDELQKDPSIFRKPERDFYAIGSTRPNNIWIKYRINRLVAENCFLELSFVITDTVFLYAVASDGKTTVQRGGKFVPFTERLFKNNHLLFPLEGKQFDTVTYFLNIRTHHPITERLSVGTQTAFFQHYHNADLLNGLLFGILATVILFNLFFWVRMRDKVYLLYALYETFMGLTLARLSGYGTEFLNFDTPQSPNFGFSTHCLSAAFGVIFTIYFLKTKINAPRLHLVLWATVGIYGIDILLWCTGFNELAVILVYLLSLPVFLVLLMAGIIAHQKRLYPARYFILAIICLSSGFVIFTLDNMGFIIHNPLSFNAMYIGTLLEAIILALGIADRFGYMEAEKVAAKKNALNTLLENERLTREQNIQLEKRVAERTSDLEIAQQQLQEYAKKLQSSNRELTDFAHIVSHDLKAPLRNIGSFAQLLDRRFTGVLDERTREYLNFIKDNARQANRLVDDILNYAKIDKNLGDPTEVPLENVVKIVELSLQSMLSDRYAHITHDNLPIIEAHQSLLTQLFQNLINNGLKYNRSAEPTVHISSEKINGQRVYKVKDNGIGIPPQYKAQVFDMFRRLHSQAEYEGTGIGLAFCKRIVETYGGDIWLESIENVGTTFFFTLPKARLLTNQKDSKNHQFIIAH
ncbi:MAG: 7TM diverse intracellular signaling domain-containing protein [Saprospiraceae bacterium]|nr:7TM diverse intracellular signaling domain-containing protein [Saprospiraceae bacterium]